MKKKYLLKNLKENAFLIRQIAKQIYKKLRVNVDIFPIINNAENIIIQNGKYLIEPITVEIDNIICNCSPVSGMKLNKKSCISFTIGIMDPNGSNKVKMAFSRSIDDAYRNEIKILNEIIIGVKKNIYYGCKIRHISEYISTKLKEQDIGTVTNICGFGLENNSIIIPNSFTMSKEVKELFLNHTHIDKEGVYFINIFGLNVGNDQEAKPTKFGTIYYLPPRNDEPQNDRDRSYLKKIKRKLRNKQDIFSNNNIRSLLEKKVDRTKFKSLCEAKFIRENPMLAVENKGDFNVYSFHVGVSILVEKNKTTFI